MDADSTLIQDHTEIDRAIELSRRPDNPPIAVPGYSMIHSLGEGAYGSVWLAREENTGKQVAIKFYTHQRGLDWPLLSREVEKLAVLYTSRHIVRLIDVGWNSEPPYYVMEYLANGSLASFLTSGPLPAHEAVRIAKGVLLALVHAHGSGILHCDLKPANVLLDNDFEPRLCDFGQSRLSNEQNPALGTLFYMAPEQADLEAIPDARWDVYALGALLHHMLCGRPPYRTREIEEAIRSAPTLASKLAVYRERIGKSNGPLALRSKHGVDRRLAEIVERCLQIDPEKRYPNAQAVLDMLELRERSRARRPLITLGIVGPSLLLIGMAWLVFGIMETAGKDAGELMTKRAVESDILSARIVAQSLKRDLDEREQELTEISDRISQDRDFDGLRNAIKSPDTITDEAKNNVIFADLNAAREESDKHSEVMQLRKDYSWFVIDAKGIEKWRSPFRELPSNSPLTVGKNYAYRDFFHGRGEDFHVGSFPNDIEPIKTRHISGRFNPEGNALSLFAVTVPIWDADHKTVIGVLGRTIEIGSLLDEYGRAIVEEQIPARRIRVGREIALFERNRGTLLDHTWFDKNDAMLTAQEPLLSKLNTMRVSDRVLERFKQLNVPDPKAPRRDYFVEGHYIDPLSRFGPAATELGGEWLAAFASVPETDWVTVVQERRSAALEPVQDMKQRLTWNGLWALFASCGLIGVLWYFVGRALNDRTPRFAAYRSIPSPPAASGRAARIADGSERSIP